MVIREFVISKPIVKEISGGYLFLWCEGKEEVLAITVARVKSVGDAIWAEISLEHEFEEHPKLRRIRINLLTQRGRSDITKRISELKLPLEINWTDLIEQVSNEVIERIRQGEPVRELWTSEDIPRPEFLLEPLLYKGLPTIIFGEKAVAKSTLALIVSICLILPWYDNPLGWVAPKHSVKALFADYEVDYGIAQWNIKEIQKGMGLPPLPLFYRRCSMPLVDDIEQIQRHMAEINAEVLIVDSLGPAVGGDLKDPGTALHFTNALRQLKCATLIIGQTSKERDQKTKSVFGSTFFEYYSRNIFELRKVQEEGLDNFDIALFNTYHNLGQRHKPQGFHLSFNGEGTHIISQPVTAGEFIERMGTQNRILDLLKYAPLASKDIKEQLDISFPATSMALKRLADKRKVLKVGNLWGLVLPID